MQLTPQQLREILVDDGFLTQEQFSEMLQAAERRNTTIAEAVVDAGLLADEHMGFLVASAVQMPFVNLRNMTIEEDTLHTIPRDMAQRNRVIVFKDTPEELHIATSDPDNQQVLHTIRKKADKPVMVAYATDQDITRALRYYSLGLQHELTDMIEHAKQGTLEDPDSLVVSIVDLILRYGYERGASDIHIEPTEKKTVVRFRIDGTLFDVASIPGSYHSSLVMRIKVISNLRTDVHRLAQDGKLTFMASKSEVDVRVSVVPITDGEKIVLRLLADLLQQFSVENIGLRDSQLAKVHDAIMNPHGMVLATGPTGSGKTTTMYALMKMLNSRKVNIATIEDPVEYNIEGVNQIQVDPSTNLTFASGLRAIVRQDPDVMMVGEIRDEETASISVNSAMTGHLVLSTLHTNDAATTLPRLVEMDIEPFLIASTINVIIAQRLVRRVCSQCVVSYVVAPETLEMISSHFNLQEFVPEQRNLSELRLFKGQGCKVCHHSGYQGRIGIFEVMEISDTIKELIMAKANAAQIADKAQEEGMKTMYEDGMEKALQGITTVDEVLRVVRE